MNSQLLINDGLYTPPEAAWPPEQEYLRARAQEGTADTTMIIQNQSPDQTLHSGGTLDGQKRFLSIPVPVTDFVAHGPDDGSANGGIDADGYLQARKKRSVGVDSRGGAKMESGAASRSSRGTRRTECQNSADMEEKSHITVVDVNAMIKQSRHDLKV